MFSDCTLQVLRRVFETFKMRRIELNPNTDIYRVFFQSTQSTFNTIWYKCSAASRAGVVVSCCQTRAVLYSAFNRGFGRIDAVAKRGCVFSELTVRQEGVVLILKQNAGDYRVAIPSWNSTEGEDHPRSHRQNRPLRFLPPSCSVLAFCVEWPSSLNSTERRQGLLVKEKSVDQGHTVGADRST